MFEHVGPKNYATFFRTVQRLMKPQGLFLLHTIGKNPSEAETDRWINKYIFPNGHIPTPGEIVNNLGDSRPLKTGTISAYYDVTAGLARKLQSRRPSLTEKYERALAE